MIRNPILPGFNPDPSICRVGEDYFIATSTFEWYPGVQIHHSRNLVDWQLITRPLRRASQLDLRGNPDSCGVWAPCLSYSDGLFWLIYTDVKRYDGAFKDAHNYLVTASDPRGDWSDPIHVNSSGFDPTLFHDDDGRKWFLNLVWNHRASTIGRSPLESPFGGIALQEYDARAGRLIGKSRIVFNGSQRGLAEGPHILKRDDWYYLIVAEGGTGYEHAVTHARSRTIEGPYELHPDHHVITADPANGGVLQRAGHGQPFDTSSGQWYHTHLCTRPLDPETVNGRRSPLGRETALQRCLWGDDGWMRLAHGSTEPAVSVSPPEAVRSTDANGMFDAVGAGVAAASGVAAGAVDANRPAVAQRALDEREPAEARGDLLACGSSPPDAHAGAPPSSVDDEARHYPFDAPCLPIDFQWLRTPDWQRLFSLDARPGHLRLQARESIGSLYEQALVARRQQHRSYEVTTTVEFEPTTFQQSAGLVAYYDRHRFHFLHLSHDESQGRILSVMSCEGDWPGLQLSWPLDDTPAGPRSPLPIPSGSIDLRVRVEGAALQFAWRAITGSDPGHACGNDDASDKDGPRDSWQGIGPVLDASILSDEAGRGEHASFTGAFVGMMAFDLTGGGLPADFSRFDYRPL